MEFLITILVDCEVKEDLYILIFYNISISKILIFMWYCYYIIKIIILIFWFLIIAESKN
jgi:hypothetical protein